MDKAQQLHWQKLTNVYLKIVCNVIIIYETVEGSSIVKHILVIERGSKVCVLHKKRKKCMENHWVLKLLLRDKLHLKVKWYMKLKKRIMKNKVMSEKGQQENRNSSKTWLVSMSDLLRFLGIFFLIVKRKTNDIEILKWGS